MYETTQADGGAEHWKGKELQAALLDSVAHEWRTPLTSIKASVSALLSDSCLEPSQRDELLVIIEEEADRLNSLMGEALETAHLRIARLNPRPYAIEEIINAACRRCKSLIGRRSVSVHLRPGLTPVRADLNRVTKALVQLLENAIKYSPPEEPIRITAELKGNFVITSVADRGSGIRKSEQALIFEKSYRGNDSRHVVPGTGMGLPIANAIITAHGGLLTVRSLRGHGSTFSFSLPVY